MTAQRREWLAIGALVLAVAAPFLRPPTAQFGDDDLEYAVPFSHFVLDELAHGRWPHWNPATDGGLPLLAQQPWMGPIYPGLVLFAALPDGWALAAGYALHAALYAVGIFLLLRRLGCRLEAAWLAAVVVGLGSDVAVAWNRGYLHHLVSVSWIAWPILGFECARRGTRPGRAAALGAIALGLAFLGGHTVSALQTSLAFCLWSGTVVVLEVVHGLLGGARVRGVAVARSLGLAAAIGVGGLALAAVQLVPLREMANQGTLPAQRVWKPWDLEMASPWRKIGYVLPGWEVGHKGRDFVGLVVLMLGAVGIATLVSAGRRDGPASGIQVDTRGRGAVPHELDAGGILPAVTTAAAFGLLSAGPHLEFFGWASALLPPLGAISYPYFFAPGIHLGLASVAAFGTEAVLDGRMRRGAVVASIVAVLSAALAAFLLCGRIAADPLDHGGLARSILPVAGTVLPFLVATGLLALGRIDAKRWTAAVLVLALFEMVSYRARARVDKPRYDTAAYFHVEDPLVRALSTSKSLGRIWHVERTRPVAEWLLRRNGGLVLGYEEINRSSRVGSKAYRDWTAPLGLDVEWEAALQASDRGDRAGRPATPLVIDGTVEAVLDGLAVDRIVTDVPIVGDRAGDLVHELTDATGMVHLYRLTRPSPRFRLLSGGEDTAVPILPTARWAGGASFELETDRDARLVARDQPPQWTVEVADRSSQVLSDGAPGPVQPCCSIAAPVPIGRHHVTLRYVAPRWPALLSLSTFVGLLGIASVRP